MREVREWGWEVILSPLGLSCVDLWVRGPLKWRHGYQTCGLEAHSAESVEVGRDWETCKRGHPDCSCILAGCGEHPPALGRGFVSVIQCGGQSVFQGMLPRTPFVGGGASQGRAVTHFGDSGAKKETEQPCVQTTREEGGDMGRGRSHGYRARAKLDPAFSRQ